MCELLIIRHAIAHERDASTWPNDDERPLNEKGIKRFGVAARGLARVFEVPDELLCSPLTRARETAAILEEKAAFPRAIQLDLLRPDAEIAALINALRARSAARLAVVGHEPGLSALISALLAGRDGRAAVEMKKGAVAQLAFAQQVEAGRGQLSALLPPSVLRLLARKSA